MKTLFKSFFSVIGAAIGLTSCIGIVEGARPVKPFNAERYLGKWYEIARFNFRFERNLNNTTATYTLNEDGSIKVNNQGYNYVKKEWSQAIGKAKFVGDRTEAQLKVSFFGPFYGAYNVIALDNDYKYALIVGKNLDYLWILSREKTLPEDIKQQYLKQAHDLGFDVDKLIWVEHN
ncbi:MAG: lipocalin family protein [Bacteroidales bacterium]|nr:lipocalin family protein [Bacteroidales bacterium]